MPTQCPLQLFALELGNSFSLMIQDYILSSTSVIFASISLVTSEKVLPWISLDSLIMILIMITIMERA